MSETNQQEVVDKKAQEEQRKKALMGLDRVGVGRYFVLEEKRLLKFSRDHCFMMKSNFSFRRLSW